MPLLGLFKRRTTLERTAQMLSNARRYGDIEPFDFEWNVRRDQYAFNEAMLNNSTYRKQIDGGFREIIFKECFGIECTEEHRMVGVYNPVRVIVDTYQNVFRGNYGQEIRVDDKVDERPVNPLLVDVANSPIRRIWKWSNLDTQKQIMQEWAANLGTVGLRIVAEGAPSPNDRRVWIQIDSPAAIVDFDEDARGNVTQVELQYRMLTGPLGAERRDVEVREIIGKDFFVKEINGVNVLAEEQRTNELGVCPYVLLRHADSGREFGRWAYRGAEDLIHWINWVSTNEGESVIEYAWAQWFAAAGGKPPTTFNIGRKQVAYVQMEPDTPTPVFEPLVPQIDQAGSLAYAVSLIDRMMERQPETIMGNIKALSGQSGETIAKLLVPVQAKIEQARSNYEHAMVRAIQIGLSEMIRMGLINLGTGTGTPAAADAAYQKGLEDFAFAPRPALPMTPYDVQAQATAEQARPLAKFAVAKAADGLVDPEEQLRLAGYTQQEAADIIKRKQTAGAIPTEPL